LHSRCNIPRMLRPSSFTRLILKNSLSKSSKSNYHSTNGTLGSTPSSKWWRLPTSKNRRTSIMIHLRTQKVWRIHISRKRKLLQVLLRPKRLAHLEYSTRSRTFWTDSLQTKKRRKRNKRRRKELRDKNF
jgi:hypothetical protein